MTSVIDDLRRATRSLMRRPAFSIPVLATLAIGIGATAAIFTAINAAFLRPLPFPRSDRLLLVWGSNPRSDWDRLPLSLPNYLDLRSSARTLEEVGAWASYADTKFALTGGDAPQDVQYALGTASLFRTLGIQAAQGRLFTEGEDRPGDVGGIVVSDELWRRQFGSRRLTDQTLTLDGTTHRIIGVLPADFAFVSFPRRPDVWLPFGLDPFRDRIYARAVASLGVVGRLRDGVTLPVAQGDLDRVARELAGEYPDANAEWRLSAVGLREQATEDLEPALVMLLSAAAVVLLIACSNVANLFLVRASERERELSVRVALGAGVGRLARHVLAEAAVLTAVGGTLGTVVALWATALLPGAVFGAPSPFIPLRISPEQLVVDWRVLGFTFAVAGATALMLGLIIAIRTAQVVPALALKEGSARGGTRRGRRLRSGLVVAQVALSLALLAGAGLLVRSLLGLQNVDPGFAAANVLAMDLDLPAARYREPRAVRDFYEALLARGAALPGVASVAAAEQVPLGGSDQSTDFFVADRPRQGREEPQAHYRSVTPGYFQTMGIRLLRGRAFDDRDVADAPKVAVISEAMAARYWPGQNPIGKRVALSVESLVFDGDGPPRIDPSRAYREVVGIVGSVRHTGPAEPPVPEVYVPFAQKPVHEMTIVARAEGAAAELATPIRREVARLDANQPIGRVVTFERLLAESVISPRFRAGLLGTLAAIAALLAAIGLYGVSAYDVAERRRELGIRMALGADGRHIARLILRDGLRLGAAGIALGIPLAWAGTRLLRGLLFGVTADNAANLALVSMLVAMIAVTASWVPARRAARVDPLTALREE